MVLVPATTLAGERERAGAARFVLFVLAGLGVLTALDLALAAHPLGLLFGGRLDFPVTYVNACSALFAIGIWPAVVTTGDRSATLLVRAAAAASGALFAALDVAAQSKGTVVGMIASAAAVLALAPQRLRLLGVSLVLLAPAAAAATPLTEPYRAPTRTAAHAAGWTVLAVAAAGAVAGTAFALVDRRLVVDARLQRRIGIGVATLLTAAAVAALAAFLVHERSPSAWVSRTWTSFKNPNSGAGQATHFTALGSHRYDFWRVALDAGAAHPLGGVGSRGFYSTYLIHGRTSETPLRAHSLYLDAFAELGVPGLLLLLAAVGILIVGAARNLSRPSAVAALGAAVYFFAHAAVDWVWTVPVVGVPAFLLLGSACAPDAARPLPGMSRALAAGAALAAAVFVFAPPWLADRFVAAAYQTSRPSADLRRARRLDPLSLEPYWAAWRLSSSPAQAAAALEQARRIEPRSVVVLYQLALDDERLGRKQEAIAALKRAQTLAPREPAIRKALLTASR